MKNKAHKKYFVLLFALFLLVGFFPSRSFAITLLTQEEALENMIPEDCEVVEKRVELDNATIKAVEERLGNRWTEHVDKDYRILSPDHIIFYLGMKADKRVVEAVILEEPGKWGPIQFIVCLDTAGKLVNMAVMHYKEVRGRPIARKTFLSQFFGKTSKDAFIVGKDISAISGATISSKAAAFCAKKAIALYEEAVLKKEGAL